MEHSPGRVIQYGMRTLIGMAALVVSFHAFAQAEGPQPKDTQPAKQTQPLKPGETVGDKVGEAARDVKQGARQAHDAVWTRCADGRKTLKGKSGCRGHGGVAYSSK
jgi:hypothetical protein